MTVVPELPRVDEAVKSEEPIDVGEMEPVPVVPIDEEAGLKIIQARRKYAVATMEAYTASWVAKALVWLFSMVGILYICLAFLMPTSIALEAATKLLPFLATPLGVIIGYYFSVTKPSEE